MPNGISGSVEEPLLSSSEMKLLHAGLQEKLQDHRKLRRVTLSRVELAKNGGKSVRGVLRCYCTRDKVSFTADFRVEFAVEGTICLVEIDR